MVSATDTGINAPGRDAAQKTCERCGVVFSCGAPHGACWCNAVKLSTEALANLRATYPDCLCPHCLPTFSNVKFQPLS